MNSDDFAFFNDDEKFSGIKFKLMTCSECGSLDVFTAMHKYQFPYGIDGPNRVILDCKIPVRFCKNCEFSWWDCEAEDIIEETIERHKLAKEEE